VKFLPDDVYLGDARELSKHLGRESVALSVWSPPYHVGKAYERGMSFRDWQELLGRVIAEHAVLLRPGAFLAVNIADILCLKDSSMPRLMGENVARRRRAEITPELGRPGLVEAPRSEPEGNRPCPRLQRADGGPAHER